MTLKKISGTSIVISFIRYFFRWCGHIEQKLTDIYHNSQIYNLAKRCRQKIKICFRNSFLGRITETKQTTIGILDTSRVVQYFVSFYKRWKDKIIQYSLNSLTTVLAKNTKKELNFSPVMIISIIIITAITFNVFLYIVLQKQISLWGWLMRGLFLFAAVLGIFCKADWPTVKRSSVVLRKIQMD